MGNKLCNSKQSSVKIWRPLGISFTDSRAKNTGLAKFDQIRAYIWPHEQNFPVFLRARHNLPLSPRFPKENCCLRCRSRGCHGFRVLLLSGRVERRGGAGRRAGHRHQLRHGEGVLGTYRPVYLLSA